MKISNDATLATKKDNFVKRIHQQGKSRLDLVDQTFSDGVLFAAFTKTVKENGGESKYSVLYCFRTTATEINLYNQKFLGEKFENLHKQITGIQNIRPAKRGLRVFCKTKRGEGQAMTYRTV
ncbi:MAG: hypothetical protein AAB438_02105 [Patescibacteria group bacterium]